MTNQDLFNDRTFSTLLGDLWKARKDAALGPVRLAVLLDYADKARGTAPAPAAVPVAAGHDAKEELPPIGKGFAPPKPEEQAAKWATRAWEIAKATPPDATGVRMCVLPLDWDIPALGEFLRKTIGPVSFGQMHEINFANGMDGQQGWLVPLVLKE